MRRSVMRRVLIAGIIAAAVGCDSSFVPPPPGKSRSSASTSGAMPVRAKEIALVLPAEENSDLTLYDIVARNEAGQLKVVYHPLKPPAGSPPGKQAELIKQAVAEGASALIVVPDATKETADALAGLDPKKTPVILLGRSPSGTASASMPHIGFSKFDESARALVAAVQGGEKTLGIKPDSPAVLVTITPPDESSAERDAALIAAMKAANIPLADTVKLGSDPTEGSKVLAEAIKGRPELGALICDDEPTVTAANAIRRDYPNRKFVVAGYFAGRNNAPVLLQGNVAALAERSVEMLVRRAVRLALDRAEGKDVPPTTTVEITLRPGSVTSSGGATIQTTSPRSLPDAKKTSSPDGKPVH